MTTRTSESYHGTYHAFSASDMLALAEIRKVIRAINAANRVSENRSAPLRVVVRGRKPVKKAIVQSMYCGGSGNPVSYDYSGNIVGGLKNATVFDVYFYTRYQ